MTETNTEIQKREKDIKPLNLIDIIIVGFILIGFLFAIGVILFFATGAIMFGIFGIVIFCRAIVYSYNDLYFVEPRSLAWIQGIVMTFSLVVLAIFIFKILELSYYDHRGRRVKLEKTKKS